MRRDRQNVTTLVLQSGLICLSLLLSWFLRFDFTLPHSRLLFGAMVVLVGIRSSVLFSLKLTHNHWRYTGIGDLKDLAKAVALGSVVFFAVIRMVSNIRAFPYSIYILEGVLTFMLLSGLRVLSRMVLVPRAVKREGAPVPVLIVGAGSAAALLLDALQRMNYKAVGLVDDDPAKQRIKLCGVPVLGSIDRLPALVERYDVSEILIATPSATGEQMLRITDLCIRCQRPFRAVPSLASLLVGTMISDLREIKLDDLLGREPVKLETEGVRASLSGRVIMVTGAAGSIGSELCRQIVRYHPGSLVCVDQSETPLFNLQQSLCVESNADVVYSVADITDTERMEQLIAEHEVKVIFHAAAYKHVPLTEANPHEALKNNVFGLLRLVEAAECGGCEDFLLISSDKAVKPSSLMGCTKRIGEMIVGARESSRLRCVSVRFGNVLGSQGSVIPTFQEQIRTGNAVTVTHPDMTRYFMTIPEAVSLTLQAFGVGRHGEILVLDMGSPVRILDLAETLIRISGKTLKDVPIIFTGMRPGEKLFEELFYDAERQIPTQLRKIMVAQSHMPPWPALKRRLDELESMARFPRAHRQDLLRLKLKEIVPEYSWEPDAGEPDTGAAFGVQSLELLKDAARPSQLRTWEPGGLAAASGIGESTV
jgi:FlaA1/EpsC-like NDP-sugar epimerase